MRKYSAQSLFLFLAVFLLFSYCSSDPSLTIDEEDDVEDIVPITNKDSLDVTVSSPYYQEMEVEHLQFDSANVLYVVFIGEGFGRRNLLKEDSKYRRAAVLQYNYLFEYPPFSQFKDDFNFSIVYAAGKSFNESAFNYGDKPSSSINYEKLYQYVGAATGQEGFSENTLILFGINRPVTAYGLNKISFFPWQYPDVMLHEVGHSFGFLGDEYSTGIERPLEFLFGTGYPNLDITDDPDSIKWKRYFGVSGYEEIGIFEGGFYPDSLVWRPSENSVMRDSHLDTTFTSLGFNAVGREAIVKEIYRLKGDSLTFEEFLEIDATNR